MRLMCKLFLAALLGMLTAGPLVAAPVSLPAGAHLTSAPTPHGGAAWLTLATYLGAGVAFGITIRKDAATIANKFSTRAAAAQGDYKTGVTGSGSTWEAGAKNGEQNWEQGVADAASRKAFTKGVTGKAGKFEANATNLGPQRFVQGVQNAQGAYQTAIQPVLDKLKSIQLPPKGPRRSPQNQQRANMVALELGKLKTGH